MHPLSPTQTIFSDTVSTAAAPATAIATLSSLQHGWNTSDRLNVQVTQYAAAAREVSKQLSTPLLDIHSIFTIQGPQQLSQLLNDGVHFSTEGNQLVFKSLKRVLESEADFAGMRTGDLPNHYPLFNQVDASNPGKTFKDLFERQVVTPGQRGGPTQ
jgi:hypothetical protein